MIKKTITLFLVLLMASPIFVTPQATMTSTLSVEAERSIQVAETDLDRVTWEANTAENSGFENWNNPSSPEDVYTTKTREEVTWYETTVVNEGTRAVGMHARTIDLTGQYSEVRLTQQSWVYWNNPINTTLDLDWYLDEIGNPTNDYFRIQVRMSSRNMYYYLGCTTGSSNSSGTGYYLIDGPTQTWNHLHRNLTSDYFAIFGLIPTQFELVYIWIRSTNIDYTRGYLDDFVLANGTYVHVGGSTLNGNFETTGGWTFQTNTNPSLVSQSALSHSGDWSMNMTAISYGYSARANAQYSPGKRLSEINNGLLSFYWRIADWINSTISTLSYMRINVSNSTVGLNMYYYFCVGGSGTIPPVIFGSDMKFAASGFNVTDTWNHFDRNIWNDYHTHSNTDYLYVDSITFFVGANSGENQLSVLFDDVSFTTSILNDMGYETQDSVGLAIEGWTEPTGYDTYTVTDFARHGAKAGNLTLEDDSDFYASQNLGTIQFDETTEIIFDFNIYFETFNESSDDDFFVFEFMFGDGEGLSYVLANVSPEVEGWLSEESNIIFLNDDVTTGEWLNFQLDLIHDYESLVGSPPDTTLEEFYMMSVASKSSVLMAFIDDMYVYYDPAPEISGVGNDIAYAGEPVLVGASVVDATLVSVVLNYRIDGGSWLTQDMTRIDDISPSETHLTDLAEGEVVEYYVTATDAFDKSTDAMDGTEYYSFTVNPASTTPTPPPGDMTLVAIAAVVVMLVVGVVIVWYIFMYKKK